MWVALRKNLNRNNKVCLSFFHILLIYFFYNYSSYREKPDFVAWILEVFSALLQSALCYMSNLPGRVVQSVASPTADTGVARLVPAWSHSLVEIDHEIISASASESMCMKYWLHGHIKPNPTNKHSELNIKKSISSKRHNHRLQTNPRHC